MSQTGGFAASSWLVRQVARNMADLLRVVILRTKGDK